LGEIRNEPLDEELLDDEPPEEAAKIKLGVIYLRT
jgi:hypothetical protein